MNASYNWLRDFVDFDLSPLELRDLLTARCATVEDVVALRQDLAGIVVGKVMEALRHPNSDHLWVTRVDSGTGELHHVVCGAPNVTVGTLYPFARVGSVLPGGLKIEKRKIRGEASEGMLCSARELGLGTDHEGIMALDVAAEPGAAFLDVMPVGDTRLVIDVLPNRPDLLSHEGLAREIAAATGVQLTRPPHPPAVLLRTADSSPRYINVSVEDSADTPRYMAISINGVTVGPSPEWLVARVEAVGARSISNVVDVTNYMLHGFGQPMHVFDLSKLAGSKVIVRRARAGEKLVTLDNVERTLDDTITVIADAEKPAAIAGVIGGKGSEVTEATTDILLEVAVFDPRRVRETRRKLGISTDASYRFERGVNRVAVPDLAAYAAELIMRVAGGSVQGPATDIDSTFVAPQPIRLRPSRVSRVLGETISTSNIESYLASVGFDVTYDGDSLLVTPPGFRADATGESELIEEVARLHGYDAFPSDIRPFRPGNVPDAPLDILSRRVRAELMSAGLYEARPMPFVRDGSEMHRVRNPLAEDEAFLRTRILDSLARRAEYNWSHMQRNVRLFEIGTVFTNEKNSQTGAPGERTHAAAIITGDRRPAHFTEPRPPRFDEWDAKELAESVASAAYPGSSIFCAPSVGDILWTVSANDIAIGSVCRMSLDAPVWAAPVFGIEIDLEAGNRQLDSSSGPDSAAGSRLRSGFVPIPTMPAIEVDMALLVPDEVTADQVAGSIRESAGELLESLEIFDEFRGPGVADGSRSLAWRLTFRHPERTLREREIQGRTAKILSTLEATLGIRQRTS